MDNLIFRKKRWRTDDAATCPQSIYSKRLSSGHKNRYGANADRAACWRNLANTVEVSVLDGDVALSQITLTTCLIFGSPSCTYQTYVLPVLVYGSEAWTITKAPARRLDAFDTRSPPKNPSDPVYLTPYQRLCREDYPLPSSFKYH